MKIVLLILSTLLMSSYHWTQEYKKMTQTSSLESKFENKGKTIKTLQADFSESIHSSVLKDIAKASGKLFYKSTDQIRWEHISPISKIMIMNGKVIKLQEKGKEIKNNQSNRIASKIQSMMNGLLSGAFIKDKSYKIAYYESNSMYKLLLLPEGKMSKYIQQIELYFNKETLLLDQLILKESDKDFIQYQFSNIKVNQTLSDQKFKTF